MRSSRIFSFVSTRLSAFSAIAILQNALYTARACSWRMYVYTDRDRRYGRMSSPGWKIPTKTVPISTFFSCFRGKGRVPSTGGGSVRSRILRDVLSDSAHAERNGAHLVPTFPMTSPFWKAARRPLAAGKNSSRLNGWSLPVSIPMDFFARLPCFFFFSSFNPPPPPSKVCLPLAARIRCNFQRRPTSLLCVCLCVCMSGHLSINLEFSSS